MLDIGIQELAVIMVLALLIFGPDKLPDLGRRLGRAMREFRRASDEFRSTVEQNLQLNVDPDTSPRSASPIDPALASAADSGAPKSDATGADGHELGGPVGEPLGAGVESAGDGQIAEGPLDPYWSSRGGRLLHRRECAWRARVPEAERIPLKTALDGWEQGLKPCPACAPREAEVPS
jgi:TatA/E family protein of Tat protein translocase